MTSTTKFINKEASAIKFISKEISAISHAEFWDRVNYYGLQAVLVLYLTQHFHLTDNASYSIYGTYTALSFGFSILGGIIADKILGIYYATCIGALLIAIANFFLVVPSLSYVYAGLAVMIMGISLFKPNNASLLGSIFKGDSHQRTKAFSIFYLCINVGSILGPIFYGAALSEWRYYYGFLLSALGMLIALFLLYGLKKSMNDMLQRPSFKKVLLTISLISVCFVASWILLSHPHLFNQLLLLTVIVSIFLFAKFFYQFSPTDRKSLVSIAINMLCCVVFFATLLQVYLSLTLFVERDVDRTILGFEIPTAWFSSLEPICIIFLVPILNAIWHRLNKKGLEPSSQTKITFGVFFSAISFYLFALGATYLVNYHVAMLVLIIIAYAVLATSELCVIPITMSLTNLLAPKGYQGTMMGIFYFTLTLSGYLASAIAKLVNQHSSNLGISFSYLASGLLIFSILIVLLNRRLYW